MTHATTQDFGLLRPILDAYQATSLWAEFSIPTNWSAVTDAADASARAASNPTERRAAYEQLIALLEQTRAQTTPPVGRLDATDRATLHTWIYEQQQALRQLMA